MLSGCHNDSQSLGPRTLDLAINEVHDSQSLGPRTLDLAINEVLYSSFLRTEQPADWVRSIRFLSASSISRSITMCSIEHYWVL